MAGALLGIGTPTLYPAQPLPWGSPGLSALTIAPSITPVLPGIPTSYGVATPFGAFAPQQLVQLQAALQQLMQVGYVQQQQLQQLLQLVPLQLQQIQQLIQFVAQHQMLTHGAHPIVPATGLALPTIGGPSGWMAAAQPVQPQVYTGQAGYVM